MTKVEVSLLFSTLDVNNDGKLQFQEFLEGMRWLNKGMNVATTRDKEAASSSAPSQERASEMALQDALDSNKILITVCTISLLNTHLLNMAEERYPLFLFSHSHMNLFLTIFANYIVYQGLGSQITGDRQIRDPSR